jgi:uncharacterized membrane protein
MDVHPIFVHFPIALLVFYSALEIFRLPAITRQQWWLPAKALMLLGGVIGGIFALGSGGIAAEAYEKTSTAALVDLHGTFAFLTIVVYGLLTIATLIRWRSMTKQPSPDVSRGSWNKIVRVERTIFSPPVLIIGATIGLLLVTIVGALGGAIVYGPQVDPVVSVVYHLFFPK